LWRRFLRASRIATRITERGQISLKAGGIFSFSPECMEGNSANFIFATYSAVRECAQPSSFCGSVFTFECTGGSRSGGSRIICGPLFPLLAGRSPLLASSLAVLGRVKRGYAELRLDGVLGSRLAKGETAARHTCRVCDGLQCPNTFDKGKPVARRGRKAYGPLKEEAGLPNSQEQDQGCNHQEWEPSRALTTALEQIPPLTQTPHNENLARLKSHLEEALETLERLEQKRGLSNREKMRGEALRMLLTSIEEVK
jgi:hypothetical protein